jgi:hypothetical protein
VVDRVSRNEEEAHHVATCRAGRLPIHEIGSGQYSGVREFASRTLPVFMQHLEHARALHAQLTGTVGTSTAAEAR